MMRPAPGSRPILRRPPLIDGVYHSGMELRHLRYFAAVAESLHFGRAAVALRLAQPSLSHQIKQLEAELQTVLLHRTKRRVELTQAGRVFLDEAREIVARADRAAMTARRVGGASRGRLRVGIGYCMDQGRIGELVSAFNARHAGVRVEMRTMAMPPQFKALRDEDLDVGFVRPPVTGSGLAAETLTREPLLAALPAAHRLASRSKIPLAALASDSFVLPPRDVVPAYHDIVLRACGEAGFVPHAPDEVDHLHMMLAIVAGGTAVALVPALARPLWRTRIAFVALTAPAPTIETAIAWRRDDDSQTVAALVAVARQSFARRADAARRDSRGT
jgi:DNA-binding transcriptional LysR family regulator